MSLRAMVAILCMLLAAWLASCGGDGSETAQGGHGGQGGQGGQGGAGAAGGGAGGSGGGTAAPCHLFASPSGSGTACTEAAPCSLEAARDAARTEAPSMQDDLLVCLRGGSYALADTFVLTGADDSGRNGHEVVYAAYAGEQPILSGGIAVTGWSPASGAVMRATVPGDLDTRQLYVDGRRARRARGALSPAGFQETPTGYLAPDATMAGWAQPSDLEVVSLVDWKAYRCGVATIVGNVISMDEPCWSLAQWHTGFDMGLPTWLENAAELRWWPTPSRRGARDGAADATVRRWFQPGAPFLQRARRRAGGVPAASAHRMRHTPSAARAAVPRDGFALEDQQARCTCCAGVLQLSVHDARLMPSTSSKCASRLTIGCRCCAASAAIQTSLSGMGRPSRADGRGQPRAAGGSRASGGRFERLAAIFDAQGSVRTESTS